MSPRPSSTSARRKAAAERLYTIGFCIGGRISLLQARSGLGLAGVIGLYPWPIGPHRSGLPAPADEAPRFACPVLAIYGGADAGIPAEARRLRPGPRCGRRPARHVVYEGAPHRSSIARRRLRRRQLGAWRQMLEFMGIATDDAG